MECLAIGSLPYDNPKDAMTQVQNYFSKIPFWPQLANVSKNEDMTYQFLEGMPSFFIPDDGDFHFDTEDEQFFNDVEEFLSDYERIIENKDYNLLEKFAISENFSSTFRPFLELIKKNHCKYAKGQITGPFTLAAGLTDKKGKSAIYDETLRELIVKILSLKALWQVTEIKKAGAAPVIFIDEPTLSQLGASSYITISREEVIAMLREISDIIKNNGGISGIHCCGKCSWTVPIDAGIDIISLDAYTYAQNLSIYHKEIKTFLEKGGKIAWGIVPTKDKKALENADLTIIDDKFKKAVNYLTKKGINEKLIIENSLVTPTCGAGSLSNELAEKAMRLTFELKERYNDN